VTTWRPDDRADPVPLGVAGVIRVAVRGTAVGIVALTGLAAMAVLRPVERPLFGEARPWTPWITQAVCRAALAIIGLRLARQGRPMDCAGAIIANHASWLDILVLNACARVYFVSKAEVAHWPFIGLLARVTGTVFIARDPKEAPAQRALLRTRLGAGHRLLFFPEGTSTDGLRVLPFKPTLFAAFYGAGSYPSVRVQPVTVGYHAPAGADPRFYGWWGGMDLAPHLVQVLAASGQGRVDVAFHPPLSPGDYSDRKGLAGAGEHAVRAGHRLLMQDVSGPEPMGPTRPT
jgi:1-acyl-sn-glycerol-3-phosphate acyltransferase